MNWVQSMLADGVNGSVSSKRVVTLLAFIVVCASYIADQFFGFPAKPPLFDSMMYIVIAGLGFTVSEKFAKKE
jgi:hypothetical protein